MFMHFMQTKTPSSLNVKDTYKYYFRHINKHQNIVEVIM